MTTAITIFALTAITNTLLVLYCVFLLNQMSTKTRHLLRVSVLLIALGAMYNALTAHGEGWFEWVLPFGALLFFICERRGNLPRVFCRKEKDHEHTQDAG